MGDDLIPPSAPPKEPMPERFGTVYLMDGCWLRGSDGKLYQAFTGRLELHKDRDVLGFDTNGRVQADWFVSIVGERQTLNLFGCQVRAILEHDPEETIVGETQRIP